MILSNLKENFNGAVDEYQRMRDILGGKASASDNSGGYGKSGDGSNKGWDIHSKHNRVHRFLFSISFGKFCKRIL